MSKAKAKDLVIASKAKAKDLLKIIQIKVVSYKHSWIFINNRNINIDSYR